jgi:hypothetical protein
MILTVYITLIIIQFYLSLDKPDYTDHYYIIGIDIRHDQDHSDLGLGLGLAFSLLSCLARN